MPDRFQPNEKYLLAPGRKSPPIDLEGDLAQTLNELATVLAPVFLTRENIVEAVEYHQLGDCLDRVAQDLRVEPGCLAGLPGLSPFH